ncbi:MAG: N(G),N(G)-dimethylarginine dimethylaminohydrolase [Deltaproteobacteria bacterium]|nr:N(G),N(G)-dimethylarginine dimethylaminohydrolase [Deltaproteobacteria bacterium]
MFRNAIVRTPCPAMINGLSFADLGKPDYLRALEQHEAYIEALKTCGVEVTVLPEDNQFPDSCFVEDVALCTPNGAILTCPGADSRRNEVASIKDVVSRFYDNVFSIEYPSTVEAGDIMMVADHYYIGLSKRTNKSGAKEVIKHLNKLGLTGETIEIHELLHLKTGVSYLENNNLLVAGELLENKVFKRFNTIPIRENEVYASNSIWINGNVIMPAGYNKTCEKVRVLGYKVIEVEMSEFRKLDGGVSCLSLRF